MGRPLTIRRVRRGKRFAYLKDGEPVDPAVRRRIERLAIPPAWMHVEIAASPQAKILARGVDAAGRTQYIYNPRFRAAQDREKFGRLAEFGVRLPTFREMLDADFRRRGLSRERVLACVLTLIDEELFRVGSPRYANEHDSYGVTTLEKQHLTLTASRAVLKFPGKSRSTLNRTVANPRVVRVLQALAELPGDTLFQYLPSDEAEPQAVTSDAVNAVVREHFGEAHTVKSFRTWGATVEMVRLLAGEAEMPGEADHPALVSEALRRVAARLENTPTVAKESYVDPRVIEVFDDPERRQSLRRSYARMSPGEYMSFAERLTLRILGECDAPE